MPRKPIPTAPVPVTPKESLNGLTTYYRKIPAVGIFELVENPDRSQPGLYREVEYLEDASTPVPDVCYKAFAMFIQSMAQQHPNDQDLGAKIREIALT